MLRITRRRLLAFATVVAVARGWAVAAAGLAARVTDAMISWDGARGMLVVDLTPPSPGRRQPVVDARDARRAMRLLARLHARGKAAGHAGDLYDNRDRGHSRLDPAVFPQLAPISYATARPASGGFAPDYGLNDRMLFPACVVGNASVAVGGGDRWRSMPRLGLTSAGGPRRLEILYRSNHIYVYPEHQDYDGPHGDVTPANTPYYLMSVGSSGSDRPLVEAVAAILAAYRPDTKRMLRAAGLVAPTTQAIFRRGVLGVEDEDAYLSAAAHPTAFRGDALDLERMIRLAASLGPADAPPVASFVVEEEPSPLRQGVDVFGDGLSEALFTEAFAAARIARGPARVRRYVLRAETPGRIGAAVSFTWRILSGSAAGVRVTPLDPSGERVEITVPWADEIVSPDSAQPQRRRFEVAVFAFDGRLHGPPAFFNVLMPIRESRGYDAQGRLTFVDYDAPTHARRYDDPALFPRRYWRDERLYDAAGGPDGWIRRHGDGRVERFTADGLLVLEADSAGRPSRATRVAYPMVAREGDGRMVVQPRAEGAALTLP
jgi:hypothetical protein